ncbi:MAG: type II toxin-antitoxin system RelE/ParE family toxin [Clostridia bacterium]
MYSIIITENAERDILETAKYISFELQNPYAANSLLDLIDENVNSLSEMPTRHQLVNDDFLSKQGFRSIQIKNYTLFYRVNENEKTVVVQRFLYSKRNWSYIITDDFN